MKAPFEVLRHTECWRNLMRGEARFDCREKDREKDRVILGGGEGEEEEEDDEGAHLCWPKLDNDLSD